jgi:RNA polymerase sigma factor (sigma-70 family)
MLFRGSRREVQLDAALHYQSPALPTDKAALARIQMEAVAKALKQIAPDRAEAIRLYYFGGLSHAETARVLNKTEAAVKMLISRGLHDLRTHTSLALEVDL